MRCPKCHYLSFEPEARCRNCGYDLALAEDDLIIKAVDDEDEGLMQDFDLHGDRRAPAAVPITLGPLHAESSRGIESGTAVALAPPAPPAPPAPRSVRPPSTTTELPLFMRASVADVPGVDVETPLVQVPASPRPPLAVRRRPDVVPEPVRLERTSMNDVAANLESVWAPLPSMPAPEAHAPEVSDRSEAPDEVDDNREDAAASMRALRARVTADASHAGDTVASPAQARLVAAGIDLVLLGGIDLVVVSLTLRICALTFGDVLTLPLLPLVAFFVLMDAGYLLLFTATSGQTLGKMATHIRVVDSADESVPEPLSLRQAIVRSLAVLPSVLALGAGFLPALGGEGLAVHDRIAHTRVVRA